MATIIDSPWIDKYKVFSLELENYLGTHHIPCKTITLVAVSKFATAKAVEDLFHLGQRHFAERRWQEAEPKIIHLQGKPITWHFIGKLQSNKLKHILPHFDVYHSIDSFRIALMMDEMLTDIHKTVSGFLQVNIAHESQKSGFQPDDIFLNFHKLLNLKNINILGLMLIPPLSQDISETRSYFLQLKYLSEKIKNHYNLSSFNDLSMGMSQDWQEAIACGATFIRIGSHIFES